MSQIFKTWHFEVDGKSWSEVHSTPRDLFPGSPMAKDFGCLCDRVTETFPEGGIQIHDELPIFSDRIDIGVHHKDCPLHGSE